MTTRLVVENQKRQPKLKWLLQDWLERTLYYPSELYEKYVYERPSLSYRRRISRMIDSGDLLVDVERLSTDGVLILPSYFKGEQLKAMQTDFNHWNELKPGVDQNAFKDFDGGKQENFLAISEALSAVAVDSYLTALVSYYWGKPVKLAYCHGYRLDPVTPREYRAFRWHHDLKRKQVRVMVLLTDTSVEGQRMDYIQGSHKVWHRFTNHRHVRFTSEEALSYGEVINCVGPAGTVVMFDANGIHRGNRNLGPRRDQYTFNYTAGRALFSLPGLHPSIIESMTSREKRMTRVEGDGSETWIKRVSYWFKDRYFFHSW
jgi:hypothetical protein